MLSTVHIIRVCQKCKRQLDGTSNRPSGKPLPLGPGQSHGICVECVRPWAESMGLGQGDVDALELLAKEVA